MKFDRKSMIAGAVLILAAGSVTAMEVAGSGWREVPETSCMTLACANTADAGVIDITTLGSSTTIAVGGKYRVVATGSVYLGDGNLPDGGVSAVTTSGLYVPENSPESITFGSSGGYGLQSGDQLRCYVASGTQSVNICRIYDGVK